MAVNSAILSAISSAVSKAVTRLGSAIRTSRVDSADGSSGQRVTLSIGTSVLEEHQGVELYEPQGFTCSPPAGSTVILLCPGGDTGRTIALAGSNGTRPSDLGPGEPAMYVGNAAGNGARIILRSNGKIEIQAGPGSVVTVTSSGYVVPPLPVARQGDPVAVTSPALLTLQEAVNAWVPVPNDGGAALKTALATFLGLDEAVVVQGTGTITAGGVGMVST